MILQKLLQLLWVFIISTGKIKGTENESFAIELTQDNFEEAILRSNHFIKFYAPWCGHCKRLHPLWEELAEIMNVKDDPKVVIAKIDCTKEKELCTEHEITSYPTLRFFTVGKKESVKFMGARDMPTITEFINQQLIQVDQPATEKDMFSENTIVQEITLSTQAVKGEIIELNEQNFARIVSTGNHFVKFYAPWCSHCQRLAPTWQMLAKTLENQDNVAIGKIDCTVYKTICQDFDVTGYPTLLWIEFGKKIEKYSGSREHDALLAYVQKMLGLDVVTTQAPITVEQTAAPDDINLGVFELTADNFDEFIGNSITFVKFYAPWCGHCKKLSPIWDDLAKKIHGSDSKVKIAKVDCTATENTKLCSDQDIEGYPTLIVYRNGKRQTEYTDSRSLKDMVKYMNKLEAHDEL